MKDDVSITIKMYVRIALTFSGAVKCVNIERKTKHLCPDAHKLEIPSTNYTETAHLEEDAQVVALLAQLHQWHCPAVRHLLVIYTVWTVCKGGNREGKY